MCGVGVGLVVLGVALSVSAWLRGGDGWRWVYDLVPLVHLLPLIGCTLIYLLGVWLLRIRSIALLLLWSIVGSVAIVLAGVAARSAPRSRGGAAPPRTLAAVPSACSRRSRAEPRSCRGRRDRTPRTRGPIPPQPSRS